MQQHVRRMRKELDDIVEKINKLGVFIYESETFETLCPFERARMIKQLGFMQSYRDVLMERVEDTE